MARLRPQCHPLFRGLVMRLILPPRITPIRRTTTHGGPDDVHFPNFTVYKPTYAATGYTIDDLGPPLCRRHLATSS